MAHRQREEARRPGLAGAEHGGEVRDRGEGEQRSYSSLGSDRAGGILSNWKAGEVSDVETDPGLTSCEVPFSFEPSLG